MKLTAAALMTATLLLLYIICIYIPDEQSSLSIASIHGRSNFKRCISMDLSREKFGVERNGTKSSYLYYYAHSGFSNQLIGLAKAAQLAYYTNRTLILPPVLPHNARSAGSDCTPYKKSIKFIGMAKDDAKRCMHYPRKHEKFSEIMDVSKISQATGVQFIDLKDFIELEPELTSQYFLQADTSLHLIDLGGKCTLNYTRPYSELVDYFQTLYSNHSVAIIPSAFAIKSEDSQSYFFRDQFLAFPPSHQLSTVLQGIYREEGPTSLHDNYIGVHVRYTDNYKFSCSAESKTNALHKIRHEMVSVVEENDRNNTPVVFFASSLPTAVICYKMFLKKAGIPTFDLEDLLVGCPDVMLSKVNVQKSILFPVLDQIIVSLGIKIVFIQSHGTKRSTFQNAIELRHKRNAACRL